MAVASVIIASVSAIAAPAQAESVTIAEQTFKRNGENMEVDVKFDFTNLKVKSNAATVLTPMIVNGRDTLRLPSVGIYGRSSYYASKRNDRLPLGEVPGQILRYHKGMAPMEYIQTVPYQSWMNGSELLVEQADYGCAGCNKGASINMLATWKSVKYKPTFIYEDAVAVNVKTRELAGRAFIDFPVNRTEINPNYRNNTVELGKIIATIDSVKNDKDVTVTSISIKGFASPEGPYDNNIRLAKGRTAALKDYVQMLYHFPADFIKTSFEPEDWEGLREFVSNHDMPNREAILAIIDSNLAPDPKNTKIQTSYPKEYDFLLKNVYPALRHSDYRIQYEIRTFSDPVEIRRILRTAPQKLSLNEIYLAAQGLEPGSDEYNEVFETAVRMFPDEAVANLNAANAAMMRSDLVSAERYLTKAGDSPKAVYARGVLAGLKGDFNTATNLVEKAISMGMPDNQGILLHLREAAQYPD